MPTDARHIELIIAAAFLVPVALGWLLSRRFSRTASALCVAVPGALAGMYLFDWKIALLTATWSFAMAYVAGAHGFLPTTLDDIAQSAKDGKHTWWKFLR